MLLRKGLAGSSCKAKMSQEERQPLLPRPPVAKTRLVLMIRVGIDLYPTTKMRVTKIRITSPLTVFLKHGQLDFFKASVSISEYLTLIFAKNFSEIKFSDWLSSDLPKNIEVWKANHFWKISRFSDF